MVATVALLHKPTFKLSFSRPSKLDSCKSTLLLRLPASRSIFFSGFGSKKAVSKTMTEMVWTSAFRSGDGEENVKILQPDTLADDSSDFRSQLMARGFEPLLNRLSKWLVAALFGVVLLWRHDAEALWIAMGSVLNAILSVTLKRVFNQERPFATAKSDPGMPSSHAQCIFYTVVFCSLSVTEWLGVNEFTLLISGLNLALGSYFSWLRVSQQYHTASQVVVGAAAGSLFSFLWYWLWQTIVLDEFNSSLWVRIVVVFAAFSFCLGFLLYVIRHWLKDEE
ncbi:conserved hypothetical protein [Ricinus communis]|uniref:Phosphatidic acid phosphatase type 2/haloperoxidase domain-containing protein n=1 Tax=Ricinus communis TaxID=3988 RepID=B9S6C7_RICCO|nr:conserved hypothetical protein [Ricinus communis]|eukprot:XP_002521546.1 lipid phosphate phosphatase epsilon 2, chloroplastic [Ricinus communis]